MQLNDKGTIYLASTESELKKGWLKCGITTRETKTRISEGNVASVREKYELLFATDTKFFRELEKYMHEKYENQKEWIKVSLPEAIEAVNLTVQKYPILRAIYGERIQKLLIKLK